jgi:uncharacterized cupredoxin-like copper-binding protein
MARLLALGLCFLILGASASAFASRPQTTGPFQSLHIRVTLTDQNINLLHAKVVRRAQPVYFDVTNVGKLKHNFVIGGQTTGAIKHGKTQTLAIAFTVRGKYGFRCTVNPAKAMHGFIVVT